MLVILDLLWKNVWDQLLNSTEQSCHPMHNPVKSSRECHMCVCVGVLRVKICLIYIVLDLLKVRIHVICCQIRVFGDNIVT